MQTVHLITLLDSTDHYENFPVGSLLVPAELRPALRAIYRFARYADDVADEGQDGDEERLAKLAHLRAGFANQALDAHPYVRSLESHIQAHALGTSCFTRLLDAFSQDVAQKRYRDLEELLAYCDRSANPVGELMLKLFSSVSGRNLTSNSHLRLSNAICSALQLINFLQDMAIDWDKHRIYLPLSMAQAQGLSEDKLEYSIAKCVTQKHIDDSLEGRQLRASIAAFHRYTETLLEQGRPLITQVPLRLSLELRAICAGGQQVLNLLRSTNYDPFVKRPKLSKRHLPALLRLFFASA